MTSEERIAAFREAGKKAFRVFTTESTKKYLGIDVEDRVVKGVREVKLFMRSHIDHMVKELDLEDKRPVAVPWLAPEEVSKVPSVLEGKSPLSIMGMVNFCGIARPDIAAPMSVLAAMQSKPKEFDFNAAEQLIRYLKGTADYGIVYRENGNSKMDGYADANGSDKEDRRTRIGGATFLADGAINWFSKKLKWVVPTSVCHGEIAALSSQANKMRTVHNYVCSMPNSQFVKVGPYKVKNDNKAAVSSANGFLFGKGLRHIELRYAHLNNDVEVGFLEIEPCSSHDNRADIFTKPLKRDQFIRLRDFLVRL
eukprot:gb/GEZN01004958.1/.p1 GENE.gb/GEZN01004958.1/~~gb/GEZN01004958.1/.p1  ORF type:complete len:310 (+),score=38.08 gb/GEZN01004958.1/:415-1344(+)